MGTVGISMLITVATRLVLTCPLMPGLLPCLQAETKLQPNRVSFAGHSSAATMCRWAMEGSDEIVLSIGGYDLTMLQWRRKRQGKP